MKTPRWFELVLAFLVGCALGVIPVLMMGLLFAIQIVHAQVPPDAAKYKHQLRQQAQLVWGLEAPVASFAAQVHQESRWNAAARSHVGAVGLSQFMPATADWISGVYPDLADNAPTNPTWALRAMLRYDRFLYDRIEAANPCERMAFALSAYNGGLGWVIKRKKLSDKPLLCFDATCAINPGIGQSNQAENADYPRRILLRHEPLYEAAGWGAGVCP